MVNIGNAKIIKAVFIAFLLIDVTLSFEIIDQNNSELDSNDIYFSGEANGLIYVHSNSKKWIYGLDSNLVIKRFHNYENHPSTSQAMVGKGPSIWLSTSEGAVNIFGGKEVNYNKDIACLNSTGIRVKGIDSNGHAIREDQRVGVKRFGGGACSEIAAFRKEIDKRGLDPAIHIYQYADDGKEWFYHERTISSGVERELQFIENDSLISQKVSAEIREFRVYRGDIVASTNLGMMYYVNQQWSWLGLALGKRISAYSSCYTESGILFIAGRREWLGENTIPGIWKITPGDTTFLDLSNVLKKNNWYPKMFYFKGKLVAIEHDVGIIIFNTNEVTFSKKKKNSNSKINIETRYFINGKRANKFSTSNNVSQVVFNLEKQLIP